MLLSTTLLLLLSGPAYASTGSGVHDSSQAARMEDLKDTAGLLSTSHVPSHTNVKSRITRRLAVVYVSPGAGTLQAAFDAAAAGDELVLAGGTYTGSGSQVLKINKHITIRAANAQQVILDGEDVRRVIKIESGNVALEGLSITKGKVVSGQSPIDPRPDGTK